MKKTTSTFIVLCASALALALLIAAGVSREMQAENTNAPIEAKDLTLDDRPNDSPEIITAWPWWAICNGTCKTEEVDAPVDAPETVAFGLNRPWTSCWIFCKTDEVDAPVDSSETIVSWIDPWWNLCLGGCKTEEADAPVDSPETVAFGLRRPWTSWPSCSIFCKNEEVDAPVSDVVANLADWWIICWTGLCKTEEVEQPVDAPEAIAFGLRRPWTSWPSCSIFCKNEEVDAPVSDVVANLADWWIICWTGLCKTEEVDAPVSEVLALAEPSQKIAFFDHTWRNICWGACKTEEADTPEEPEAPEALASDEFGGCLLNDEPIKLEELVDCRSDLCFAS